MTTNTTNPSDLVDQVARALYAEDAGCRNSDVDWNEFEWSPHMKTVFFAAARAVIPIVMEAAAQVADAEAEKWRVGTNGDCYWTADAIANAIRARAALNGDA